MRSLSKAVLAAALACSVTAVQAGETELWFRKAEKVALARGIRQDGYSCPEIRAVYFVEAKADANHMRAVCGTADGPAASSSFSLTVRASGTYRVAPWSEGATVADVGRFASDFTLRMSPN